MSKTKKLMSIMWLAVLTLLAVGLWQAFVRIMRKRKNVE